VDDDFESLSDDYEGALCLCCGRDRHVPGQSALPFCIRCLSGAHRKCRSEVRYGVWKIDPKAINFRARSPGPRMPCGWGCGATLTNGQMRRHFTTCPRRPNPSRVAGHKRPAPKEPWRPASRAPDAVRLALWCEAHRYRNADAFSPVPATADVLGRGRVPTRVNGVVHEWIALVPTTLRTDDRRSVDLPRRFANEHAAPGFPASGVRFGRRERGAVCWNGAGGRHVGDSCEVSVTIPLPPAKNKRPWRRPTWVQSGSEFSSRH
jgi:hypothetical protein